MKKKQAFRTPCRPRNSTALQNRLDSLLARRDAVDRQIDALREALANAR